ncbi:MAG TPA: hypothetical protein DEV64_01610 [Rhodospirillaceae bacterium]|nr:hypothetical protein [Rhodospirillaceae bacterium]|tara:strand:- start:1161 stop:2024 length:864 start_codon:yes stop_codon:yes gene_type:complete
MNSLLAGLLPDGRRLHLQHGPIDLVIEAFGPRDEIGAAYRQARTRFETVLTELVEELAVLRQPVRDPRPGVAGPTAIRMMDAVWPHRDTFVTSMAAVAGSVADEVMASLIDGRSLDKAYINNSGDIAVYLTPGQTLRLGIVGQLFRPAIDGTAELSFDRPVRGVATSGWQGRSWSFGIADAVTVLAESAAAADVAATLIANNVNVEHPTIERAPASELDDQTDLGSRLVTVDVGRLDADGVAAALNKGMQTAQHMCDCGLITAAVLVLKDEIRAIGDVPAALPETAN